MTTPLHLTPRFCAAQQSSSAALRGAAERRHSWKRVLGSFINNEITLLHPPIRTESSFILSRGWNVGGQFLQLHLATCVAVGV